MKIRSGFVSNSSSSSFVLKVREPFSCPIEVAHHMIPQRKWDNDLELLETLLEKVREKRIGPETNVCFSSCNYDTYIYFDGGPEIRVETCHNTDWEMPPGSYAGGDEYDEGIYSHTFFKVESSLFGRKLHDSDIDQMRKDVGDQTIEYYWCSDCHCSRWITSVKSDVFCPSCGKVFASRSADGKWELK